MEQHDRWNGERKGKVDGKVKKAHKKIHAIYIYIKIKEQILLIYKELIKLSIKKSTIQ
jgi:hypothetical protein